MKCWTNTLQEPPSAFTDVEQWKQMQLHLASTLAELEPVQGDTPEEEGELVLAL